LRDAALGRVRDLKLRLDGSENFTRLRGHGIRSVGLNRVCPNIVQGFPKNITQSRRLERADDGHGLNRLTPRECAFAFC